MNLRRAIPFVIPALGALALGACAARAEGEPDDGLARSDDELSWEEFLATVERDPLDDSVWIVDGDVPIDSDKRLVDFYESRVADDGLTVARAGGSDAIWPAGRAGALTYCVSTSFGSRYDTVVASMASAAGAWEAVADVDFQHVASEDGDCDARNTNVLFDVRPVSGASYLARAFFPYQSRRSRNVIIDASSFRVRAPLSLIGVLRHELGHVLGFRHEHTRPEAGRCYEDADWRGVTEYDRASVMHYPQCGGTNGGLVLSERDAAGAAALYGTPGPDETPAPDAEPEPDPAPSPGTPSSGAADGSVRAGQEQRYRAIEVLPGTAFRVETTGTGDADLYVRFGSAPTTRAYDCRPYRADSHETCELTVPAGERQAHVMVRGYTDASYRIEVRWTAP